LKRKKNIAGNRSDLGDRLGRQAYLLGIMLAFYLVSTPASPLWADIYKYIDSKGVVHYTNTPTSSDFVLYIRETPARIKSRNLFQTYDAIIQKAQEKYGIEFFLIKAVIHAESGFNPQAVSKKGAKGLMQIMPENYKALSVSDPFDPSQNIMGGTRYLKKLLKRYENKLPLALAAYNAGPEAVDKYKQIPPFRETQDYVQKVMTLYSRYKNT
jgi:soluble lytic murein transglycosylase-like protein